VLDWCRLSSCESINKPAATTKIDTKSAITKSNRPSIGRKLVHNVTICHLPKYMYFMAYTILYLTSSQTFSMREYD
jgi:hypothetical protein